MNDDKRDKTQHPTQKQTFARIHSDLKSALDQFDKLSSQTPSPSADEKRLQEMQELLKALQAKMKELDLL